MTEIIGRREPACLYPESFKRRVIEEHLLTGMPKAWVQKKHGIRAKSAIMNWMRDLGYVPGPAKTPILRANRPIVVEKKRKPADGPEDPRHRIEELERQLEDERLRSELYLRMIEVAEKEYKVPIRKKPGTK